MFYIKPKENPRWFQLRIQLSRFLFWLGKKVDPSGPYTNSYLTEQLMKAQMDCLIYGQGKIKIEHVPFGEET